MGGLPSDRSRIDAFASRWLTSLGLAAASAMLTLGGLAAYSAHQDAFRLARKETGNIRLALERDIGRNLAMLDLSLQGVIEALAEPDIDRTPFGVRQLALFDRAATAEDLGALLVQGPTGVVTDSSSPARRGQSFADGDYFTVQREDDAGLHLSRSYAGRPGDDGPGLVLSRRLPSSDGRFAGVVSGALDLRFLQKLFGRIDVGPNGSIALLSADGHLISRYPSRAGDVGRDVSGGDVFRHILSVHEGNYVGPATSDGVTRLFAFGPIKGMPLILSVNFAIDDVYARWRQKAVVILPILLLICVAIIALSLLFRREMRRRETAESAWRTAARDLSIAASTDALTGLANRRTFEDRFDMEWKRAIRDRKDVSLLMVDADAFKALNDLYGHQEGDRILKAIAVTLKEGLLRPADLAARYGGEEFVVLLPDCDAEGAELVAERIRSRIEALAIPHAKGNCGLVTVCVGAATTVPTIDGLPADLLRAADGALYVAKRDGRNAVRVAQGTETPTLAASCQRVQMFVT